MRKYRPSAATPVRVDYGVELAAGLELFPETSPLAAALAGLTDDLEAAYAARRALRRPLVRARANVRLANYTADQAIRAFHAACRIADGGRIGPVTNALFPDGLGAVVAPAGARQVQPTEKLVDRLTQSRVPGADSVRTDWLARLQTALDALRGAVSAHGTARGADQDAFDRELALREEHLLAVDKLAGLVRAAFPGDRDKQDVVFPQSVGEDDAGEGSGSGGGEGSGGGTSGS
jgi:hypothetical protein